MTLDQALREITQKITCVAFHNDPEIIAAGKAGLAPTGEPFLSLCSGGFKEEGKFCPCLCLDAETAIRSWRLALFEYAAQKPGILYWRHEPELVEEEGDGSHKFWVYSRLLISDRPALRQFSRAS
jgi:hypothetical protein